MVKSSDSQASLWNWYDL